MELPGLKVPSATNVESAKQNAQVAEQVRTQQSGGQTNDDLLTDTDNEIPMPSWDDEDSSNDERPSEPMVHYKHRLIKTFKVGEFKFTNHILSIPESKVDAFLKLYAGLAPIDKANIKQLRHIQADLEVEPRRVVRDSLSSDTINVPTRNMPVPRQAGEVIKT